MYRKKYCIRPVMFYMDHEKEERNVRLFWSKTSDSMIMRIFHCNFRLWHTKNLNISSARCKCLLNCVATSSQKLPCTLAPAITMSPKDNISSFVCFGYGCDAQQLCKLCQENWLYLLSRIIHYSYWGITQLGHVLC
jgi:hypothetical protein